MNCGCSSLPEFAEYFPGDKVSRALEESVDLQLRKEGRELYKCRICGTHWRIDYDVYGPYRFVWKIGAYRPDWCEFSKRPEEIRILEAEVKESERPCSKPGCDKPSLVDSMYCKIHAFAHGVPDLDAAGRRCARWKEEVAARKRQKWGL